ncbi:MAG TPA: L,D-transpeptidase [Blastocatellia bacterium]|jgi:lipoprotein-anchoring transpeptidase ErfK/SrfK|nr:L,D-transpeptidase [Blastocatellia bacterium]
MSNKLRSVSLFFIIAMALIGPACAPAPPANTNVNTNTAPAPPTATHANADTRNMTVTLPLLEALFTDESFTADVKSRLQLSDEQINNLKTIAREQTAQLREVQGEGEYEGTTAAARSRAMERIEAALGKEKAGELAALVNERWNTPGGTSATSGASGASATSPGAVPTDTRIVVNAPAFRMDVFESGKLVKTYRVGIGYPEFPLPSGLRKADTIIFNPTWTPPDEPWVEAPGSNVKVGETVKAGDKLNPLGPIKIPIGLPSLIHGGKAPSRIGTFASHGCVGLTNPQIQDFSQLLGRLGGTPVTSADIAKYAKNKTETQNLKLQTPVPVELRYETIAVVDGKLHIYRDVYDRNTNTEENLRAVLAAYNVTPEQLSESERAQVTEALREMSRDARGNLDSGASSSNSNTSNSNARSNSNSASKANANNRNDSGEGRNVTRTIKGRKEAVIEIAALNGKGYPAPVNLDMGGSKPEPASNPRRPQSTPASGKKGR